MHLGCVQARLRRAAPASRLKPSVLASLPSLENQKAPELLPRGWLCFLGHQMRKTGRILVIRNGKLTQSNAWSLFSLTSKHMLGDLYVTCTIAGGRGHKEIMESSSSCGAYHLVPWCAGAIQKEGHCQGRGRGNCKSTEEGHHAAQQEDARGNYKYPKTNSHLPGSTAPEWNL